MSETAVAPVTPAPPYFKSEARPEIELKKLWRHSKGEVSFEVWLDLRDRARKDLFWLGKAVLRKDLTRCHVLPCKRLFVQKDFNGVYHEGYTLGEVHAAIDRQVREKEMLWLDPRGAFKSTLDGIDCVQWMLNVPDIRILILTGEFKLALAFMSEIKGYFYQPDKADPTLLQQMFPEYIIHEMTEKPLDCPARIHHQKEPSLWVNAIVANLSGWHCDLRKMDDVVTDENSNTVESREKLKLKIDTSGNLVDEWGFTDILGTRYYTDDYYGDRLKARSKDAPLRFVIRACWSLKKEFEGTALEDIRSEMVNLLFPEKLTFQSLRRKLLQNERVFRCFPAGSPVLMADWTEKSIEDLQVGDKIIGFTSGGLVESAVTHTHAKKDFVVRAVTNQARAIFTTKDHEFLKPINTKRKQYASLKIGAGVVSVYKPYPTLISSEQKSFFDWLGGLLDGEGTINSQIIIHQSESKNAEICHAIRSTLMILGIPFSESTAKGRTVTGWKLQGGRSLKMLLLKHARMAKKKRVLDALWHSKGKIAESSGRRGGSSYEKIVSIEIIGEQPVYDITTTTSNYVCQGFAVHNCQQLNEPAGENESVTFTEDALKKQLVAESAAPKDGDVFISWDWSFSRSSYADYSAGCAARLNLKPDGVPELYLMEVIFGRWKPSELAFQIVNFSRKWKPQSVLIEKSTGAELLQMEIARQALRYQVALNIMWKKVSTAPDSKRNNIKGVETLINNEQLFFVGGPWIDETFSQLIRYTGERKNRGRKDDIPDAIGFLQFFLPSTVNNKELEEMKKQQQTQAEKKAEYSRIFDTAPVRMPQVARPSIKQQLFGSLAR